METLILIGAMVLVGLLIAWLAGFIWKGERPRGARTDYLVSVIAAVITGLLDWYVIPAMGFSDPLKYAGTALEPPLVSLFVLWLLRRAQS